MTLWHSDEFHLYRDGFDTDNVYLQIQSPHFEELVLKIPLTAWKGMRQQTIQPNEQYLDFTEEKLRAEAEREVDAHRAGLDEIRREGGKHAGLRMMLGSFVFGSPDASREEMIQHFVDCYSRRRTSQDTNHGLNLTSGWLRVTQRKAICD
jgi:hypothetical protein